jgi:hypothetical protein
MARSEDNLLIDLGHVLLFWVCINIYFDKIKKQTIFHRISSTKFSFTKKVLQSDSTFKRLFRIYDNCVAQDHGTILYRKFKYTNNKRVYSRE